MHCIGEVWRKYPGWVIPERISEFLEVTKLVEKEGEH